MVPERCPKCGQKRKRSTEANRYYWLLLHAIADKLKPAQQGYTAETWHHYFKLRLLGAKDVKLPNGKVVPVPLSSSDLDKTEFQDYVTQVEAWAAEHNVHLDDLPNG